MPHTHTPAISGLLTIALTIDNIKCGQMIIQVRRGHQWLSNQKQQFPSARNNIQLIILNFDKLNCLSAIVLSKICFVAL